MLCRTSLGSGLELTPEGRLQGHTGQKKKKVLIFLLLVIRRHAWSHTPPPQRDDEAGQDADLGSFLHEIVSQLNLDFETLFPVTVLAGGSAGVGSSIPTSHRSPGRPRASSQGDGRVVENGIGGGAGVRGAMPDHWEQAFSDTGESHYIE